MAADRYTDGTREIQYFTQSVQMMSSWSGMMADVLYKTLALLKDDPVNKALAESLKHDDAVVFETDNFDEAADLRKKLSENGVEFTATAAYKDRVYVVVPKGDLEHAQEVVNDFYDSRSHGVFSPEYINEYANGEVKEIRGLSETEASLYVERCKDMHVPVTVDGPSDGSYRIRFAARDEDKMARIRIDAAVSMRGPAKEVFEAHLKWRNEYEKAVLNTAISGKFPDDTTVQEGSAVVGADGKRVEVTKQYIKLFEGASSRRFSRNADGAELKKSSEEISRFVKSMDKPVFLSKEEYALQKSMDTGEREAFFASRERAGFLLPRAVYQDSLVKRTAQGRAPDGTRFRDGDMIVAKDGSRVEFNRDGVVITRNGQAQQTIPRDDVRAMEKASEAVEKMQDPVYLTAAKAERYEAQADKESFLAEEEILAREFVAGRPEVTRAEKEALAKAESMRHTVDIRLQHDGIELPKTEQMTYHDAAQVFGMTAAEAEGFNAAMQQDVMTSFDEDDISDVLDAVEEHFGKTDPCDTVVPISREIANDRIFDEQELDQGFELGNDFMQSELDLDEF